MKQIIGATFTSGRRDTDTVIVNFESAQPAEFYARMFLKDKLSGGHVIRLDTEDSTHAARQALSTYRQGLRIGGGIRETNAKEWLDAGAKALIFTSWIFHEGIIDFERLKKLKDKVGKDKIVLDLSCRRTNSGYRVFTDQWTRESNEFLTYKLLDTLSSFCREFLVHAIDNEGQQRGISKDLIRLLNGYQGHTITYAGGISAEEDLLFLKKEGANLDFTVGSALDIFGGNGLRYRELVKDFGPRNVYQ